MTVKDHSATTAASKKGSTDDVASSPKGVANVGLIRKQRIDQKKKADYKLAAAVLEKRKERLTSLGGGRMT